VIFYHISNGQLSGSYWWRYKALKLIFNI